MSQTGWNSRYLAYCRARGCEDPAEMWERDGNGHRFIIWIRHAWNLWGEDTGHTSKITSEQDHRVFDAWLETAATGILSEIRLSERDEP